MADIGSMIGIGGMDLGGMASTAGQVIVILIAGVLFVGGIGIGAYLYMKNKAFKTDVIVYKRFKAQDGREMTAIESKGETGAIIKDKKTKRWVFHLRRANVDLGEEEMEGFDENREIDLPTIPGPKGREVMFIEKVGNKKYAIGEPFVIEGNVKILVSNADVAEAIRSYDIATSSFGKQTNPIWGFVIYITFAVLVLVLVIVVLQKIEYLSEFGDKWLEGARIMGSQTASQVSNAPG